MSRLSSLLHNATDHIRLDSEGDGFMKSYYSKIPELVKGESRAIRGTDYMKEGHSPCIYLISTSSIQKKNPNLPNSLYRQNNYTSFSQSDYKHSTST